MQNTWAQPLGGRWRGGGSQVPSPLPYLETQPLTLIF